MSEAQKANTLIEIIETLAPEAVHAEASAFCMGKGWYFGNRSSDEHSMPFWKMDLEGVAAFDAIWEAARPRCEELAGSKLRVIRQYADGHTYGLGGQPHRDDARPGTFTLLYYPMSEWKAEWQGETVFHEESGEIGTAVLPKPNRGVFFDARILHSGRAPSRSCPELRVTVAFKLEAAPDSPDSLSLPVSQGTDSPDPMEITEVEREGPRRSYRVRAAAGYVDEQINGRLQEIGKTIRLPGFRTGKIPVAVLEARYGAKTRNQVVGKLGSQAAERLLGAGGLPSSIQLVGGADSGDVELVLVATHLSDLPDVDCQSWELERLTASEAAAEEAGLTDNEARQLLAQQLHREVLDLLHAAYTFPIAPPLVEREYQAIRQAAEAELPGSGNEAEVLVEFREIAERRVRLGAVVAELARRHRLQVAKGDPALESRVIEWLISRARVTERPATPEELQALLD